MTMNAVNMPFFIMDNNSLVHSLEMEVSVDKNKIIPAEEIKKIVKRLSKTIFRDITIFNKGNPRANLYLSPVGKHFFLCKSFFNLSDDIFEAYEEIIGNEKIRKYFKTQLSHHGAWLFDRDCNQYDYNNKEMDEDKMVAFGIIVIPYTIIGSNLETESSSLKRNYESLDQFIECKRPRII